MLTFHICSLSWKLPLWALIYSLRRPAHDCLSLLSSLPRLPRLSLLSSFSLPIHNSIYIPMSFTKMISGPSCPPLRDEAYRPATPTSSQVIISSERDALVSAPNSMGHSSYTVDRSQHPLPSATLPSAIPAPSIKRPYPTPITDHPVFQSPIPQDNTDNAGRTTTSHPLVQRYMNTTPLLRPRRWTIEDGENAQKWESILFVLGAVAILCQPEHHNHQYFWPVNEEGKHDTVARIVYTCGTCFFFSLTSLALSVVCVVSSLS